MQDKGYFFAPDFDKKNILAYHVQQHNHIAISEKTIWHTVHSMAVISLIMTVTQSIFIPILPII